MLCLPTNLLLESLTKASEAGNLTIGQRLPRLSQSNSARAGFVIVSSSEQMLEGRTDELKTIHESLDSLTWQVGTFDNWRYFENSLKVEIRRWRGQQTISDKMVL